MILNWIWHFLAYNELFKWFYAKLDILIIFNKFPHFSYNNSTYHLKFCIADEMQSLIIEMKSNYQIYKINYLQQQKVAYLE